MRIGRTVVGKVGDLFILATVVQLASDQLKAYVPGLKRVVTFKRGEAHVVDKGGHDSFDGVAAQVREAAGVQVDGQALTNDQIQKINSGALSVKTPFGILEGSAPKALPKKAAKQSTAKPKAKAKPKTSVKAKAKKLTAAVGKKLAAKPKAKKASAGK
jgi:hypothetical protein